MLRMLGKFHSYYGFIEKTNGVASYGSGKPSAKQIVNLPATAHGELQTSALTTFFRSLPQSMHVWYVHSMVRQNGTGHTAADDRFSRHHAKDGVVPDTHHGKEVVSQHTLMGGGQSTCLYDWLWRVGYFTESGPKRWQLSTRAIYLRNFQG